MRFGREQVFPFRQIDHATRRAIPSRSTAKRSSRRSLDVWSAGRHVALFWRPQSKRHLPIWRRLPTGGNLVRPPPADGDTRVGDRRHRVAAFDAAVVCSNGVEAGRAVHAACPDTQRYIDLGALRGVPPGAAKSSDFFSAEIEGHATVAQSDRCLDCHHATMRREVATHAHNLNQHALEGLRVASAARPDDPSWHDLLPRPVDSAAVQCSVCHREHQGAQADLLAVSDTQCQTCHHDRFGNFASSHPDWDGWPYGRGGDVSFDHASHAAKHFPGATLKMAARLFNVSTAIEEPRTTNWYVR